MLFGKEPEYSLIQTSSREALSRSALLACHYDIKKAQEVCEYFTKYIPSMPDTDPVIPSTFDQVKDAAASVFQWGKENQEQVVGITNMIMQMMGKQPLVMPSAPTEVPPPIE